MSTKIWTKFSMWRYHYLDLWRYLPPRWDRILILPFLLFDEINTSFIKIILFIIIHILLFLSLYLLFIKFNKWHMFFNNSFAFFMNQVSHSVLPVSENIGESGRSRRELKVGAKKSGRSKNSKWIKKNGSDRFSTRTSSSSWLWGTR